MSQTLFTNATLACVDGPEGYGLRESAGLRVVDGIIDWVGPMHSCPEPGDAEIFDCEGRLVTPGLID